MRGEAGVIGTITVGNAIVSKGLPADKTAGMKPVTILLPVELGEDSLWELGKFASILVEKEGRDEAVRHERQ